MRKQQSGGAESLPEERELEELLLELLEEAREVRCMLEARVMNGVMEG